MADDTNKVTIDADYFAELYAKANGERYTVLEAAHNQVVKERDNLIKKLNHDEKDLLALTNEHDELNAALDKANKTNSAQADQLRDALNKIEELKKKLEAEQSTNANIGIVFAMKWKDKLAAAERCIEDIDAVMSGGVILDEASGMKIESAIRAYREKKETAR